MPAFLTEYFPPWLLVITFCLLAAHAIATIATFTNVSALNASYDVLQPLVYRKRGWGDARIVLFSRFASLVTVHRDARRDVPHRPLPNALWDAYYFSSGLLSAGVAVVVLAMFWKRVGYAAASPLLWSAGSATLVLYLVEKYVLEYDYPAPHALTIPPWLRGRRRDPRPVTLVVVTLLTQAAFAGAARRRLRAPRGRPRSVLRRRARDLLITEDRLAQAPSAGTASATVLSRRTHAPSDSTGSAEAVAFRSAGAPAGQSH